MTARYFVRQRALTRLCGASPAPPALHALSALGARSQHSAAMPAKQYKTTPYAPPSGAPAAAPGPSAFARRDEDPDTAFYATPRFVTHIDDGAIAALRAYYAAVLPRRASPDAPAPRILDFCSSWISHYPADVETAAAAGDLRVTGLGLNAAELARNPVLNAGRAVRDLNAHPAVDAAALGLAPADRFAALTCTVSIDYLTEPVAVLRALRALSAPGASVHLAVSNRCFPTKVVRRWAEADEQGRLRLCCEDLWRAGWRDVETVEVTDGRAEGEQAESGQVGRMMAAMGLRFGGDPLWVVRGTNPGGD